MGKSFRDRGLFVVVKSPNSSKSSKSSRIFIIIITTTLTETSILRALVMGAIIRVMGAIIRVTMIAFENISVLHNEALDGVL